MAHWAKLNSKNKVEQVIVSESSPKEGTWVQTSYNTKGGVHLLGGTPFRKNFAVPGYTYDSERDAFIPPKPYESWVLNEQTCLWENPVLFLQDDDVVWDAATNTWVAAK